MKTFWDDAARADLRQRLSLVGSGTRPQWGKMNAAHMLSHLLASARMANGELTPAPISTPFKNPIGRWLAIYVMPWPKGTPTAPELQPKETPSIDDARVQLDRLFEQLAGRSAVATWPTHPAFGAMSRKNWGALLYKHFDHHLRQFGV